MAPIGQLVKPTSRAVQAITRMRTHVAIDTALVVVRTPTELEPRARALLGEFLEVVELARVQACAALASRCAELMITLTPMVPERASLVVTSLLGCRLISAIPPSATQTHPDNAYRANEQTFTDFGAR